MRSVFVSTPGFLGRITGATRCSFWVDEPIDHDFDASRLIEIDLARTPSAALAGSIRWDEVQVDDCYPAPTGGLIGTTIGPAWPELQLAGLVGLEQTFRDALPELLRPPCPPRGIHGRDYEFQSVVYWPGTDDPRAGKRYAGHHGKIVSTRGTVARVAIYPPTTSDRADARPVMMWIDLASPAECDAGPHGLTRLGTDGVTEGPLFLISGTLG